MKKWLSLILTNQDSHILSAQKDSLLYLYSLTHQICRLSNGVQYPYYIESMFDTHQLLLYSLMHIMSETQEFNSASFVHQVFVDPQCLAVSVLKIETLKKKQMFS